MIRLPFRPLYGAVAVAFAVVGLYPGLGAMAQSPRVASTHPPSTTATPVGFRGTLVAIHRTALTGDLALADGTLLPLRFATVAQERRLQAGARLVVTAVVHGRARLLVRTVRPSGHNTRVHLHGVVARLLPDETIEILGQHGAAVLLHLVPDSGLATSRPRTTVPGARAARVVVVYSGAEIDTDVRVEHGGTLTALRARLKRVHATHNEVEVEGIVRAINPAAGTITIENEDGQRTVVAVGARVGSYYVGEHAAVSGRSSGRAYSAAYVAATAVEREDGTTRPADHGDQVYPGATETAAAGTSATPIAAGEDRHGGKVGGCYYSCPPTPVGTAVATAGTPDASGDDHHGGGSGGTTCYYTCPPSPTAGTTAGQSPTPTASGSDDNDNGHSGSGNGGGSNGGGGNGGGGGGHDGGGVTGCYYTCPPTATGTAPAPQATATASSDDNHGGGNGGVTGCYYTCPPSATATSTTAAPSSTAPPTAAVQTPTATPPTATPTDDEHQRGKPTPSATAGHS